MAGRGQAGKMTAERFGLEGDQQIRVFPVTVEGGAAEGHINVAVSPHDVRMVFAPADELQAVARAGAGKERGNLVDALPLGASQSPGNGFFVWFQRQLHPGEYIRENPSGRQLQLPRPFSTGVSSRLFQRDGGKRTVTFRPPASRFSAQTSAS